MQTEIILLDIEGTTTSIRFVHQELFPYAYDNMPDFIRVNWQTSYIATELKNLKKEIAFQQGNSESDISQSKVIEVLQKMIKADKKDKNLKSIQGKQWKIAYETGKVKGHLYPDVKPMMTEWQSIGVQLCIFSSGSIEAQKLLFKHSMEGDLTKYITEYFDTSVGSKRKKTSYLKIAENLQKETDKILFLSDIVAELDAAKSAGMQTLQLIRDDESDLQSSRHKSVNSFSEIQI